MRLCQRTGQQDIRQCTYINIYNNCGVAFIPVRCYLHEDIASRILGSFHLTHAQNTTFREP